MIPLLPNAVSVLQRAEKEENYAKYLGNRSMSSLERIDVVYGGEVTALLTGQPQRGDAESAGGCSGKRSQGVRAGWGGETSV